MLERAYLAFDARGPKDVRSLSPWPSPPGQAACMRIRFAAGSDDLESRALSALRARVDAFWAECGRTMSRAASTGCPGEERLRLERTLTALAGPRVRVEIDLLGA